MSEEKHTFCIELELSILSLTDRVTSSECSVEYKEMKDRAMKVLAEAFPGHEVKLHGRFAPLWISANEKVSMRVPPEEANR